ncbi:MAG: signal peptidase I [bacterium]
MYKQYSELVKTFFQTYAGKRRQWVNQIAEWKEEDSHKDVRAKMEALMAQIEEYHAALNALLVQVDSNNEDRIARLYKQMKQCYKELVQISKPLWRQWIEAIVIAGGAAFFIRTFGFGIYHVPTGSAERNILVGDRLWGNKMAYRLQDPKRGELVIFNDPEFVYSTQSWQKLWQQYAGIPLLGILKGGPQNWVKRVIAVPGDTIEGRMEDGKTVVYLNGEKLHEPYVNPYPLIRLRKTTGFFNAFSLLGSLAPGFLRRTVSEVRYTYDPSVPLDQQPFYYMQPEELIRNPLTGDPLLLPAGEPCFEQRTRRNVDVFGPLVVPQGKYWVMGDSRRNSRDSRFWMFLDEEHVLGRASLVLYSLDSEESFWFFALLKNPLAFFTRIVRWDRFMKPLWGIAQARKATSDGVVE